MLSFPSAKTKNKPTEKKEMKKVENGPTKIKLGNKNHRLEKERWACFTGGPRWRCLRRRRDCLSQSCALHP